MCSTMILIALIMSGVHHYYIKIWIRRTSKYVFEVFCVEDNLLKNWLSLGKWFTKHWRALKFVNSIHIHTFCDKQHHKTPGNEWIRKSRDIGSLMEIWFIRCLWDIHITKDKEWFTGHLAWARWWEFDEELHPAVVELCVSVPQSSKVSAWWTDADNRVPNPLQNSIATNTTDADRLHRTTPTNGSYCTPVLPHQQRPLLVRRLRPVQLALVVSSAQSRDAGRKPWCKPVGRSCGPRHPANGPPADPDSS